MIECTEGLPEGARLVNLIYDHTRDVFELIVEHESFAPVPEGELLPRLDVTYTRYRRE
jgi:hypothetical protein